MLRTLAISSFLLMMAATALAQAPSVQTVLRLGPTGGFATGQRDWIVSFDEPVTGVGADDFVAAGSVCGAQPSIVANVHPTVGGIAPRIAIPSVSGFNTGAITIEMWVRTTDPLGAFFAYATSDHVDAIRVGGPSALNFTINDTLTHTTTTAINDGNWHHLAVTLNTAGPGLNRIIVDGITVSSLPLAPGASWASGGYLTLGQDQTVLGTSFGADVVGDMDEVRVWNYARSNAEILSDMGRRLTGTETGLDLYLPMDEFADLGVDDANTDDFRDFSGNGNHADTLPGTILNLSDAPIDGSTHRVRLTFPTPNVGLIARLDVLNDGSIQDLDGNNLTAGFSGGAPFPLSGNGLVAGAPIQVPADIATLQAAIDIACPGDTIELSAGTYTGGDYDFGGKHLRIVGMGDTPQDTVLNAQLGSRIAALDGIVSGTSEFVNLSFVNARAIDAGGLNRHGGAFLVRNSSANFFRCNFDANRAGNGVNVLGGRGGALHYANGAAGTVEDCVFSNNRAGDGDDGQPGGDGGAITIRNNSDLIVRRCRFTDNDAGNAGTTGMTPSSTIGGGRGGAIWVESGGTDLQVFNSSFVSNQAGDSLAGAVAFPGSGGAIAADTGAVVTLRQVTISSNNNGGINSASAQDSFPGSAISHTASVDLKIYSSIVRGAGTTPIAINGSEVIENSNVKSIGNFGLNNFDAGAQFVNIAGGNIALQSTSPCIDAGGSSAGEEIDIDGRLRNYGTATDVGAYEFYDFPGTGEDFTLTASTFGSEVGNNVGDLLRFRMTSPNLTFLGSPLTLAAQIQSPGVPAPETFPGAFLSFNAPFAIVVLLGDDGPLGPPVIGLEATDYFLEVPAFASGLISLWQAFALDGAQSANGIFASSDAELVFVR